MASASTTTCASTCGRAATSGRGRHTWSAFVEVTNLLNRGNQARPDGIRFILTADGKLRFEPDYESWLPLLPTIGIRWTF